MSDAIPHQIPVARLRRFVGGADRPELLDRFYNLICLDTGTGVLDSANRGILRLAEPISAVTWAGGPMKVTPCWVASAAATVAMAIAHGADAVRVHGLGAGSSVVAIAAGFLAQHGKAQAATPTTFNAALTICVLTRAQLKAMSENSSASTPRYSV